MRVRVIAAIAAVVVGLGVLAVWSWPKGDETPEPPRAAVSSASAPVEEPAAPATPVAVTRTIFAEGTPTDFDRWIDQCRGPVAIDYGDEYPVLVAEHDYCGGSDWIPQLKVADRVALDGPGIEPGTYEVTEIAHDLRGKARIEDIPPGDVVLQTCVSKTELVLVAARRLA